MMILYGSRAVLSGGGVRANGRLPMNLDVVSGKEEGGYINGLATGASLKARRVVATTQ
jgi:hypothetical protein